MGIIRNYTKWLHTQWPAGKVEKLPQVNPDGTTNVKGVYIVGDLTGIPLLKFSSDTGARAVESIANDPDFKTLQDEQKSDTSVLDLVIIGAGVSGLAAALQAEKHNLSFKILEATQKFSTVANFPKGKPIFTYPTDMTPLGDLQFTEEVKEPLLDEMEEATKNIEITYSRVDKIQRKGKLLEVQIPKEESLMTRKVIIAIGRSGNFRKLNIPGEDLDKVSNRLHDPKDFAGKNVMVVGGGDSALETAISIAQCGGNVTISYRKPEFSRPKPDNIERIEMLEADPMADVEVESPTSDRVSTSSGSFMGDYRKQGKITRFMGSSPTKITDDKVTLKDKDGKEVEVENDNVFLMIGREAPLDFFRRSGIKISGETYGIEWVYIAIFFLAIWWVYDWKGEGFIQYQFKDYFSHPSVFPNDMPQVIGSLGDWFQLQVDNRHSLIGTIAVSMKSRSFYYTLAYTMAIGIFGWIRIRRRRTPYVKLQTITLFLIQFIPLFLLPEIILPLMGYNGFFNSGLGATIADNLFEKYISAQQYANQQWPEWGHPRAYWRAYGFILAWPLSVYNVFTSNPMPWWLVICFIQTFVLIPVMIYYYGKGAYCGWICSCGGLAETMGDNQRHKMPHGPFWNRLNMVGQVILLVAFILLTIRVLGWIFPESWMNKHFALLLEGKWDGKLVNPVAWKWVVDVLLGGIIGVGLYFKYSGRVWCRFACPLAALMHIYARFSRFRIIPEKKKCISCNVCTSVCHQGIDIMNFANKGLPMNDPECVRCSACVQSCPTGVLTFGQVNPKTNEVIALDKIPASRTQMAEKNAK